MKGLHGGQHSSSLGSPLLSMCMWEVSWKKGPLAQDLDTLMSVTTRPAELVTSHIVVFMFSHSHQPPESKGNIKQSPGSCWLHKQSDWGMATRRECGGHDITVSKLTGSLLLLLWHCVLYLYLQVCHCIPAEAGAWCHANEPSSR